MENNTYANMTKDIVGINRDLDFFCMNERKLFVLFHKAPEIKKKKGICTDAYNILGIFICIHTTHKIVIPLAMSILLLL